MEATTMQSVSIAKQIEALTPEAQKIVSDLVLLLSRQPKQTHTRKLKRMPLNEEKFIGMWQDREDMADSVAYVKNLRKTEWS